MTWQRWGNRLLQPARRSEFTRPGMSRHARKSSPTQFRMLTAAMATGGVVAAGAALAGTQPEPVAPAKPPALARTASALIGLQIPTPNTLLTAATGTWTTGAAGGSGANSSGAGLLGALTG